jgi:alanine dehydrogenase
MPGIKKVHIYDPMNFENAKKFQDGIKIELGKIINDLNDKDNEQWLRRIDEVEFIAADVPEEMLKLSDAVITITPSRKPLLKKEWIKPGTHLSCIGADVAGKQEIDEGIFKGAIVCVDDCQQAMNVGETQSAFRANIIESGDLIEIGHLIIGECEGRRTDQDITIFDSTGISLQDLAVSNGLVSKAEELNLGEVVQI